jgi:hypothetical protein
MLHLKWENKQKGDFMGRLLTKAFFLIAIVFCITHAAAAADASSDNKQPKTQVTSDTTDDGELRDPAAIAELKRATDFLVSLPRFHIKSSLTYDVIQEDGRPLQFEKVGDIYIQRPDRFYAEIKFDDGRLRQYWYDGKMLSLAERSKKIHTQLKAPPTIDETLDMLEGLFKEPQPMADLYYSNLDSLDKLAIHADVVGDSLVGSRQCTHLSFRGRTVDWQIWVEKGPTPFIRKLVISYREESGAPQAVALIDVWETPKKFKEDMFKFKVPADSQWIDVLVPTPRRINEGGQP